MLMNQLIHLLTQQLIHPPYAYSLLLMPCFVIAYKAYVIVLQSPQLLTHLCLLFLLIHLLTDQLHCLLISLLIAYSYMLTPLLTDCLQSPYCCLTNPCFFYKSCLLSPMYISCTGSPAKKAIIPLLQRRHYPSIPLCLDTSDSLYQVSESCRSLVKV